MALRLISFAPNSLVRVRKQIPSSTLTLTSLSPVDRQKIREPIPSGSLRLTGVAPNIRTGKVVKQIPPGYLRLISYAPRVPAITTIQPVKAGGGKKQPGRKVIIGGRRYIVYSYTQLSSLLDAYLKDKQQELQAVEAQPGQKKRIKVLRSSITQTENRIERAKQEWIEQENEAILLLLAA